MNRFRNELLIIFLARQGYWTDKDTVSYSNLLKLIFRYIASSFIIVFIMLFFKNEISTKLKLMELFHIKGYLEISIYISLAIIVIGTIYENYFLVKNNSISTMNIFFNISFNRLGFLILAKNSIIMFPLISFLLFYIPVLVIAVTVFANYTSIKLIKYLVNRIRVKRYEILIKKNILTKYVVETISIINVLKYCLIPVCSMLIFFILKKNNNDIISNSTECIDMFFEGFFYGTIFFGTKNIPYLFFSIFNDLNYFKGLQMNFKLILKKIIIISLVFPLIFYITAFVFISILLKVDINYIHMFILGMIMTYFMLNMVQMNQSLYFQDKKIRTINVLEKYKIPFKNKRVSYMFSILSFSTYFLYFLVSSRYNDFRVLFLISICSIIIWISYIWIKKFNISLTEKG